MYDWFETAGAAWRTIVHVSEWSGLSIGALIGIAAVIYLFPAARKPAIAGGVLVLVGWICLIHGNRVGRADVNEQWADARKAAIEAEQERKNMIENNLELTYQPKLAELQRQSDERKARADGYARKIALLSKGGKGAPGACELGAAADRVPAGRQAR